MTSRVDPAAIAEERPERPGRRLCGVFEAECQARGLELFVLPPKRPDLNGCAERAQSTWRYEFYATYDLTASNR
jgi:hypothetical protein